MTNNAFHFLRSFALVAAVACLAWTQSASAAIVYSEDFNGLTVGDGLQTSSASWNGSANDYTVQAGGAVFTDQHLELTAPDANFNFANFDNGNTYPVMTFSADFVDLGTSTSTDASVRIAMRRSGSGSAFRDATAAGTPDNTIVHYDLVINTGAAAVLYEDGVNSIGANTLELWIDGVLTESITPANGSGDAFSVGLWNRRPDSAFLADNFEIRDTAYAAIPEPASLALMGFGLAFIATSRKRK